MCIEIVVNQQEISHILMMCSNYIIKKIVFKYNDKDQVFKIKTTNLVKKKKHNVPFFTTYQ